MKDIDEAINDYNQNEFKDWNQEDVVTFDIENDLTGKTITVILSGDFITVKNCRDKIIHGFHWHQGSLRRETIK